MHWFRQRTSPARQLPTQTPAPLQTLPDPQTLPQLPQLLGSPARLAQYAVAPVPHSVVGLVHPAAQAPAEQTWPAGQTLPQEPQLRLSVAGLMHSPRQLSAPGAQVA